jgi:hypothetical protein
MRLAQHLLVRPLASFADGSDVLTDVEQHHQDLHGDPRERQIDQIPNGDEDDRGHDVSWLVLDENADEYDDRGE